MPAKKKRAATAPSRSVRKPAAKKAASQKKRAAKRPSSKKPGPKKAATKKAATKKAATKKAATKKAATKKPGPNRAGRNGDATRKPATKKPAPKNDAVTRTLIPAALPATLPAPTKVARPALPPDPTEELAQGLAALTLSKKADDVVILHVTELTSYADFFVLASAPSERQVQAIARHCADELKKAGRAPLGTEGLEQGHWVLVDYGAVVLHVFLASARQYYDLEGFWSDAPHIDVDEARGLEVLAELDAIAAAASARAADADETPAFAANE